MTDVTTMAGVARVVENVGVTAYLGAAHLLSDPILLTAADPQVRRPFHKFHF